MTRKPDPICCQCGEDARTFGRPVKDPFGDVWCVLCAADFAAESGIEQL